MLCLRILECSYSGKGTLPKTWIKTTRLRKKVKRMWVVQVGNRMNGVKNLFVVRGKNEMVSAAADSLVIFALWKPARAAGRRGLMEHLSPSRGMWDGCGDTAGRAGHWQPGLTLDQAVRALT